jgi:hypothetical protein
MGKEKRAEDTYKEKEVKEEKEPLALAKAKVKQQRFYHGELNLRRGHVFI